MELAGIIIAAIAALAAIAAAVIANRQRKDAEASAASAGAEAARAIAAAEDSAGAATRSATAAESSAVAADRSADAHSTLAQLATTEAGRPPWQLQHVNRARWEAENLSPTPVFGVEVTGDPVHHEPVTSDRVDGGSSIDFLAVLSMGSGRDITVTWHTREDLSDPKQTWTRPLPRES